MPSNTSGHCGNRGHSSALKRKHKLAKLSSSSLKLVPFNSFSFNKIVLYLDCQLKKSKQLTTGKNISSFAFSEIYKHRVKKHQSFRVSGRLTNKKSIMLCKYKRPGQTNKWWWIVRGNIKPLSFFYTSRFLKFLPKYKIGLERCITKITPSAEKCDKSNI